MFTYVEKSRSRTNIIVGICGRCQRRNRSSMSVAPSRKTKTTDETLRCAGNSHKKRKTEETTETTRGTDTNERRLCYCIHGCMRSVYHVHVGKFFLGS